MNVAREEQAANRRDLAHYFEYSNHGVEVVADGLQEITFGEFLVQQGAITRAQLLRALQLQDRNRGTRIGECVAALGVLSYPRVEQYLRIWNSIDVVEI